jgi:hypothetical protein
LFHEDVILAADLTMKLLFDLRKNVESHKSIFCIPSIKKAGWPNGKALDYD